MRTILAALVALAFFAATPAFAEDAADDKGKKEDKKKDDKKDSGKATWPPAGNKA